MRSRPFGCWNCPGIEIGVRRPLHQRGPNIVTALPERGGGGGVRFQGFDFRCVTLNFLLAGQQPFICSYKSNKLILILMLILLIVFWDEKAHPPFIYFHENMLPHLLKKFSGTLGFLFYKVLSTERTQNLFCPRKYRNWPGQYFLATQKNKNKKQHGLCVLRLRTISACYAML